MAALFALHPLHVESVAWVAERKDVLSTFFWMLTLGAYCLYVERPVLLRYLSVVLFFVLGLMAKPMLVTLPFVLLLLDYWPLKRLQLVTADQKIRTAVNKVVSDDKQTGNLQKKYRIDKEVKTEEQADNRNQWTLIRPLLWEKIPLFILTILSSIVTYVVQQKVGTVASIAVLNLSSRISNAFVSYITYIGKTIWPSDLAVFYPHPIVLPIWHFLGAAFLLIVATGAVIGNARRAPYLVTGWLWYLGTLVPVIGIVQVGFQGRADRYTYVPLIGLFIVTTWGISEFSKKWRYRKEVLFASSILILFCFCIVAWTQVRHWQNSITLFNHALNVTDNNSLAYNNRGTAYANFGNNRQAIADYDKAIEISPKYTEAYHNRGIAHAKLGNYQQAIEDYNNALEINPNQEKAYYNRGNAYAQLGNHQQAIEDYGKALEINPNYEKTYYNRGAAYLHIGNLLRAITDFNKAIDIDPKDAESYYNRAYAFSRLANNNQALKDLQRAARLGYKNAQDQLNRHNVEW